MFVNLSNIASLNTKYVDYRCIITGISKSDAIKLLQKIDLTEKVEHYTKSNIKSNVEAINLPEILIETKIVKNYKLKKKN